MIIGVGGTRARRFYTSAELLDEELLYEMLGLCRDPGRIYPLLRRDLISNHSHCNGDPEELEGVVAARPGVPDSPITSQARGARQGGTRQNFLGR
jgi:hypothetical protein